MLLLVMHIQNPSHDCVLQNPQRRIGTWKCKVFFFTTHQNSCLDHQMGSPISNEFGQHGFRLFHPSFFRSPSPFLFFSVLLALPMLTPLPNIKPHFTESAILWRIIVTQHKLRWDHDTQQHYERERAITTTYVDLLFDRLEPKCKCFPSSDIHEYVRIYYVRTYVHTYVPTVRTYVRTQFLVGNQHN